MGKCLLLSGIPGKANHVLSSASSLCSTLHCNTGQLQTLVILCAEKRQDQCTQNLTKLHLNRRSENKLKISEECPQRWRTRRKDLNWREGIFRWKTRNLYLQSPNRLWGDAARIHDPTSSSSPEWLHLCRFWWVHKPEQSFSSQESSQNSNSALV